MAKSKKDNIIVKCPNCKTKFVRPRSKLGEVEECGVCGPKNGEPTLVKMVEVKQKTK